LAIVLFSESFTRLVAHPIMHENSVIHQVGLGFSPDVAAEAATHWRFAFNGERGTLFSKHQEAISVQKAMDFSQGDDLPPPLANEPPYLIRIFAVKAFENRRLGMCLDFQEDTLAL
jgi:hypothetical protein